MAAPFTATDLAACAKRGAGYRRRVYAKRVANGGMRQATADREIAMMEKIAADYEAKAKETERLL